MRKYIIVLFVSIMVCPGLGLCQKSYKKDDGIKMIKQFYKEYLSYFKNSNQDNDNFVPGINKTRNKYCSKYFLDHYGTFVDALDSDPFIGGQDADGDAFLRSMVVKYDSNDIYSVKFDANYGIVVNGKISIGIRIKMCNNKIKIDSVWVERQK